LNKGAFLDRDGIINEDLAFVSDIRNFNFKVGIFNLLRLLSQKGYMIFIITNQSGIARKYYGEQKYQKLTNYYKKILENLGIRIQDIYHCPHHPEFSKPPFDKCFCRKPKPGLFLKIKNKYRINMQESLSIGDTSRDLEAAFYAGIKERYLINKKQINTKYASNNFLSLNDCSKFIDKYK